MSVLIVVPMEPALLNHYVRHTRSGRHYKTPEALSFEEIGAIACRGLSVLAKRYSVRIDIYQGAGKKGDLDGYAKQPLDLIANNGVLLDLKGRRQTDSHVVELHMTKQRDAANPRTVIQVWGI